MPSSLGTTAMVAECGFVPSCHGRAPKTGTVSPYSDSTVHHTGTRQNLSCWARHLTGTDRLTHGTFPAQPVADPTALPSKWHFCAPRALCWPGPWCAAMQGMGELMLSHGFTDLLSNNCLQLTKLRASEEKESHSLFASNLAFSLISCSYTLSFDPVPWSLHKGLNNSGHPKLQCWKWQKPMLWNVEFC